MDTENKRDEILNKNYQRGVENDESTGMGWTMGLEPTTTGITIRGSTN